MTTLAIEEPKEITKASAKVRDKVRELYDRIRSDLYLCREDMEVGSERYNSALALGTMTELNKGKQLLYGEYGGGKTTVAEYLHSLYHTLPLDLIRRVSVRADPQKTDEKMIARPDYGALHGQKEKVVWQHFVLVGPKIVDEFNRLPESNQSMLLNGVDRGDWNYLNDSISTGPMPLFATCNYADKGNNGLIPPLLDRFDVSAESKFPGVANVIAISMDYHNGKDRVLKNEKLTEKAIAALNSGMSYRDVRSALEDVAIGYREHLAKEGFPVIEKGDLEKASEEIGKIPLDNDAQIYFTFLAAELNLDSRYGQKRSIDSTNADAGLYLGGAFEGAGSRRAEKAIIRYAQSLAWLQDAKEVSLDHILNIAPHVLWHRLRWTEETKGKFRDNKRKDPLELYIAKTLVNEGTDAVPGVKKRFLESRDNYQKVLDMTKHGKIDEAYFFAEKCASGGKGHPIFMDVMNDLR
jgi:MoxR-like ATPase